MTNIISLTAMTGRQAKKNLKPRQLAGEIFVARDEVPGFW